LSQFVETRRAFHKNILPYNAHWITFNL
jgi:hypothetical protein